MNTMTPSKPRIPDRKVPAQAIKAMRALAPLIAESGLEPSLLELVRMRASQLNGCARCLDMHSKDARAAGETEQRLYLLGAWREVELYSPRERAALAWTEAVTRLDDGHVSDEVHAAVREQFSEDETIALTLQVIEINGWNRLNVAFRGEAGNYQPGMYR